ncbi:MAG: hypothetical protein AAF846_24465 [Chloroflexota bacterium]
MLIWKYPPTWTLEEFHLAIDRSKSLAEQISHPYVAIIDYSGTLAPASKVLSAASAGTSDVPDNLVAIINVKPRLIFALLMRGFQRFFPHAVQILEEKSLDDAINKAQLLLDEAKEEKKNVSS